MLTDKEIKVLKLRSKGMTQIQVAHKLKITQAAVSSFERNAKNKITDAKTTLDIARELDYAPNGERNRGKQPSHTPK